MFKQNIFAVLALIAALCAGAIVTVPSAHAKNGYDAIWVLQYPDSSSLANAGNCLLCHDTSSGGGRSAYGADMDSVMPAKPSDAELTAAFIAIEGFDSDNDPTGSNNLEEINANTQPGWAEGDVPGGTIIGDLDPVTLVADISVSPLAVDFGAVTIGASGADSVAISNVGNADLTVDSLALSGSSEFSLLSSPATPFTVAASTSVDLIIEYAPVDDGLDNGILEIVSDSPGEESINVALSGTGDPIQVIADGDLAPFDNPDGFVNAADELIALQITLGQREAGALQIAHGDINGDDVIDAVDLKLIQNIVMQN